MSHATHLAPPFSLCCPRGLVPQGSIALTVCPNPSSHPMYQDHPIPPQTRRSAPLKADPRNANPQLPHTLNPCGASPSPPPARQQAPLPAEVSHEVAQGGIVGGGHALHQLSHPLHLLLGVRQLWGSHRGQTPRPPSSHSLGTLWGDTY